MGTMLILIGLFDLGFASLTAAASIELGRLAGVVAESSTLITFGHAFSQMSGGLLDIGSADEGAIVKSLIGDLPPIWLSLILAIGRLLLALASIVLGIALAKRMRSAVLPLSRWAFAAAFWGLLGMIFSIGLYGFVGKSTGTPAAGLLVLLDLSLHILWPLIVLWRIRLTRIL